MATDQKTSGCASGGDNVVPILDFSKQDNELSADLYAALSTVGFTCLVNTGVWEKADAHCQAAKQQFFCQSIEEKEKYKKPPIATDDGGWVSVGREKLSPDRPGDYKEAFNIYLQIQGDRDRAPDVMDGKLHWEMWRSFTQLADRVNLLIGQAMELKDPRFLCKAHSFYDKSKNRSSTRINWYPKLEEAELKPGQIRCGEHTDYGSITLLYSDSPGLEVKHRETGEFVCAGHTPGGIFVNIGDLLQMWSGDQLVATVHRVSNPVDVKYLTKDRFSVVFFAIPDDDTVVETLDGSDKYPTVTSGRWLTKRFEETYDIKE